MPYNLRILSTDDSISVRRVMERIGVHPEGIRRMLPKSRHLLIHLEKVGYKAAHILKQELLALGGDAAVSSGISSFTSSETDIIVICTEKQLEHLIPTLRLQPFGLKKIATELEQLRNNLVRGNRKFICGNSVFDLADRTYVMGILNVTPDSFSDGTLFLDPKKAIDRAFKMVEEGADIIDIGGESTRPGAAVVSEEEEIGRIKPVLEYICPRLGVPISIDTYKGAVARMALDLGATIVNDISGLRGFSGMAALIAQYNAALVIMHMQGTPRDMQQAPAYEDVNGEILGFLRAQVQIAEEQGVNPDSIAVDPGIGFGKTIEHNLEILADLETYTSLGKPVLIGPSRKSFIGKILDREVNERIWGTSAVAAICAFSGADIIRVHDIHVMKDVVQMVDAIRTCMVKRENF